MAFKNLPVAFLFTTTCLVQATYGMKNLHEENILYVHSCKNYIRDKMLEELPQIIQKDKKYLLVERKVTEVYKSSPYYSSLTYHGAVYDLHSSLEKYGLELLRAFDMKHYIKTVRRNENEQEINIWQSDGTLRKGCDNNITCKDKVYWFLSPNSRETKEEAGNSRELCTQLHNCLKKAGEKALRLMKTAKFHNISITEKDNKTKKLKGIEYCTEHNIEVSWISMKAWDVWSQTRREYKLEEVIEVTKDYNNSHKVFPYINFVLNVLLKLKKGDYHEYDIQTYLKEEMKKEEGYKKYISVAKALISGNITSWPTSEQLKTAETLKGWKKSITEKNVNVLSHMKNQKGLDLTPSHFEVANYLMEKEVITNPSRKEIEATAYLMNLKNFKDREQPNRRQINLAIYVIEQGILTPEIPHFKAARYLIEKEVITSPSRKEIEATAYIIQTFPKIQEPELQQIKAMEHAIKVGFSNPNSLILKATRYLIYTFKAQEPTKEQIIIQANSLHETYKKPPTKQNVRKRMEKFN